ncbi:MAG TPA: nitrophenyl compound nitroreductase subunit ArsF family protein [Bacteroidales bacterium]|nr:nitrophenyl compound nitroreductase subunit ArsF family protein [Bacteroidales bacterium]
MNRTIFLLSLLLAALTACPVYAQKPGNPAKQPTVSVYYFHPTERCPIDQSIEETTRTLMRTDFSREIKEGTVDFRVINTDDKANQKLVSQFVMNAQALYVIKHNGGKETRNDLTEFAFSHCQGNPGKFKAELKQAVLKALQK